MVLELFCHFIHSENLGQAKDCKQMQFHKITQECNFYLSGKTNFTDEYFSLFKLVS